MIVDIEPRKKGRQQRARVTQEAIIEAVARFLESDQAYNLTTNRIAEIAGVSIGSLYQYFPNKEAILVALIRRERSALLADVKLVAQCGDSPKVKIEMLVEAGLKHQFERPRLAAQLENIEQTLQIGEEAHALSLSLAEETYLVLKEQWPDVEPSAAGDVVAICHALINSAAWAGETDYAELKRRIVKAVYGYLN